jgi:phosphatidylglycerophosphatase A
MQKASQLTASRKAILAITSVMGLGYLPKAPGTWGTLAALPIWWALQDVSWGMFILITVVATGIAVVASDVAEKIYGSHDVQHIVIDEVVGMMWTVIGVPWRMPQVVVAFVLFRLLDSLKPWPIRWFDEKVHGGFGVVIDDVVAGCVGCALLHTVAYFMGEWWSW